MMQKKSIAPSNNQPKITKNGRPEESNFVKKQVSQLNFQRTEIQITIQITIHHLSPSSTFVGRARPMTPTTKKGLMWIRGLGAMAATNTMTRSGALAYRPEFAVNGRRW
jgi:hypothetical protein